MSGFLFLLLKFHCILFFLLIVMEKNNLIIAPAILGKFHGSWSEQNFKYAVKKFRQNAPSAPIPRLYDAYRWLKIQLDSEEEELNKQFTYFVEIFLRILEERGAGESEVYSEVLRDSAEYKYLKGLFHTEASDPEVLQIEMPAEHPETVPPSKKITFKDVLSGKNISLTDIDINEWHKLIDEHLRGYKTEELFVKNCLLAVNNIKKRTEKESYHVEIIIVYAFDKLLHYKTLSLKTKDFAMQLLNLMTDHGEMWTRLHKEYLEIIRK